MADPGEPQLPQIADAEPVFLAWNDVALAGYAWWASAPAPAFLLLHGWGEDASTLAPVARQVKQRGWHAISMSLRGWRGSTGVDDYGLSAARDIGRVLDWIREHPIAESVVLLGFSMGGLMAALAAAEQATLAGVILVSSPSNLRTFYRDTAYGGVRRYFDQVLQPQQWRESSPLTHASEITHPTLVVTGLRDTMTPADQGTRMAAALPRAELLDLPDMEHHPTATEWELILDQAGRMFCLT